MKLIYLSIVFPVLNQFSSAKEAKIYPPATITPSTDKLRKLAYNRPMHHVSFTESNVRFLRISTVVLILVGINAFLALFGPMSDSLTTK